jgi:crossover junction endonuclease MUS81
MAETCSNPLYLKWIKEWLELEEKRNSKGANTYKKAYKSMQTCPFPLTHPSEAQLLEGIGEKIVKRLTEALEDHCKAANLPMPKRPKGKKRALLPDADGHDGSASPSPPKKKRTTKPKAYVPAFRSGGYALIIALSTLDPEAPLGLTKQETIARAELYCDASFTAPSHANKYYTAWDSMKTLINKQLVLEKRPAKRYELTDEGWEVARRINAEKDGTLDEYLGRERNGIDADDGDLVMSPGRASTRATESPQEKATTIIPDGTSSSSLPEFSPIILPPGTFTVELVIDNREVRAKDDREYIQTEIKKRGVTPIVRALALGDFLWVAKCNNPALLPALGVEGEEVVLDYIVERKRLDDLIGSIKDGRFHEQKFRLRKSGVKNVVYLIEETTLMGDKYEQAVESAIAGTQVVDGFFVRKTQKTDDSIRYLARMTVMLKEMYEAKPLHLMPTKVITTQNYLPLLSHLREKQPGTNYHVTYPAFASLASKAENLTLRDVFLKMIMCTKGVTGEKAIEIQKRWKTPRELMEAYDACGGGEEGRKKKIELVSKQMSHFVGRKKIAKAVSFKIAEVWGDVMPEN